MKVTIGEKGLTKTWQDPFSKTTVCAYCGGESRIGFVAHEGLDREFELLVESVGSLHDNRPVDSFWLHDYCAVAVYFCKLCLKPTALYNQG